MGLDGEVGMSLRISTLLEQLATQRDKPIIGGVRSEGDSVMCCTYGTGVRNEVYLVQIQLLTLTDNIRCKSAPRCGVVLMWRRFGTRKLCDGEMIV